MSKTKHQNLFSKWLLAVILLLSVFSFAGTTSQIASKQDTWQSTVLANKPNRLTKSISFNRANLQFSKVYKSVSFFATSITTIAILHSLLANIKIKNVGYEDRIRMQIPLFYQRKTTTPNTNDEPHIIIG